MMSFKGSKSNIEVLGSMVNKTGGQLDAVDPSEVLNNLESIFSDDTVAKDVKVRIYVPDGLEIQNKRKWKVLKENVYCRDVGGVNSDSNMIIGYKVKQTREHYDFQMQIEYTRVEDNKKLLRVLTNRLRGK